MTSLSDRWVESKSYSALACQYNQIVREMMILRYSHALIIEDIQKSLYVLIAKYLSLIKKDYTFDDIDIYQWYQYCKFFLFPERYNKNVKRRLKLKLKLQISINLPNLDYMVFKGLYIVNELIVYHGVDPFKVQGKVINIIPSNIIMLPKPQEVLEDIKKNQEDVKEAVILTKKIDMLRDKYLNSQIDAPNKLSILFPKPVWHNHVCFVKSGAIRVIKESPQGQKVLIVRFIDFEAIKPLIQEYPCALRMSTWENMEKKSLRKLTIFAEDVLNNINGTLNFICIYNNMPTYSRMLEEESKNLDLEDPENKEVLQRVSNFKKMAKDPSFLKVYGERILNEMIAFE
jgi:hypothetical protein